MTFRERTRLPGRGSRFALAGGFWTGFKWLGWPQFMPRGRVGSGWLRRARGGPAKRQHRCRHGAMKLVRWQRATQGLPCWGLGAVAGWPWG